MSYPSYGQFEDDDYYEDDEESMTKEERKIQRMKERQRKLPLLLGGFTLGGFVMGMAYGLYLRSKKN